MIDQQEEMLNEMSDKRKAFLAKHMDTVDPDNNIYLDNLIKHKRFDLIKKYKLNGSAQKSEMMTTF